MAGFGGAVKLTGESEYRRALSKITQSLKEVSSELKLVTSQYDKNDSSTKAVEARTQALNKQLEQQQSKLSLLKSKYAEMLGQFSKQESEHNKLVQSYKKEKEKLEEIGKTLGTTSKEYQEQKEKVDALEKEVESSTKAYDKSEKAMSQMRTEINKTETECNKTAKEIDELGKETDETADSAKEAGDGFTVMRGALANLVAEGIKKAISGLKNLAKQLVATGVSFDSTMASVGAISGATSEEMEQLEAKAKELGETTAFTATEVGEGFKYMAMAGWETEDMLEGISGILSLAAASGEDLGTTSDIVTDALTAMGYAAGDAGRLANVMAAASSNSNTNVSLMGETFKYAAPLVGALGYSMEDTAVAIGMMANAGVKGTQAGTSLRSILSRMSAPTGAVEKAMKELGISLTDNEGNMKSLDELIRDLRSSFSGLTEVEKASYASTLAGKNAMSGFLAIVNSADDDFNRLTAAVNSSAGAAQNMSETMLDNVGGQFTLLKSQLEGIMLTIYEKLEPSLRKAMTAISSSLRNIDWDSIGKIIGGALEKVVSAFTWLLEHADTVAAVVKGVIAAFVAAKVAAFAMQIVNTVSGMLKAVKAAESLGGAMSSLTQVISGGLNPVVMIAAAVAGLTAVFIALNRETKESDKLHEDYMSLLESDRETIDKNIESWNGLKDSQQEALNSGMSEMTYLGNLKSELADITDENGKVKKGYEERANFITSTLSEALGIEIEMVNGVIQNYGELMGTLDEVMEKKKAQIILDSQAGLYSEAISKQQEGLLLLAGYQEDLNDKRKELTNIEAEWAKASEAYQEACLGYDEDLIKSTGEVLKSYTDRKLALKEELTEAEKNYNDQEALVQEYAYNIATYEKNMALAHEGNYGEMTTVSWEYVKEMEDVGDAEKKELENRIKAEKQNLSLLEQMYEKTGDDIYRDQITQGEKRLKELESQMNDYNTTSKVQLAQTEVIWSDSLDEQLSELTGAKIEFRNAGRGNVQMFIDGVAQGEAMTKTEMASLVNGCITELNNKKGQFNTVGQNFTDGVGVGIQNRQGNVFGIISNFGNSLLLKLKNTLSIKSPSKATREMGRYLSEGLALGIVDKQSSVNKQIEQLGEDSLNTFEEVFSVIDKINAENAGKSAEELSKLYVSAGKTRVTELKNANKLSEAEEINFWESMARHCKRGTDAYNEAVSQLNTARTALRTDTAKLTQTFTKDIEQVNSELEKNIEALKKTYSDAYNKTYQKMMGSSGLFDTIDLSDSIGKEPLLDNLNSQVKTLKEYNKVMNKLRGKITNQDLIDELESQGVGSLNTLKTILKMSDSELAEYETLYEEKQKYANKIAKAENAELLKETNEQIASLKETASKQIETIKKQYIKDLKALGIEGKKESRSVGNHIAAGINTGLTEGFKSVTSNTKKQLKNLIASIKKELKIKSPSRVFRDEIGNNLALGIGIGFVDEMKNVTQQMQDAIPTTLDAQTKVSGARYAADDTSTSASMISAFKEALSQVKIVLDDQVAGEFIDKTVTNIIYA